MKSDINLNSVYAVSEDVVARDVQGEFVIIPITSGIGDLEDEIFSLNGAGRAFWDKLDGKKNLRDVVNVLTAEFEASGSEIEDDVLGISRELLKRKILVEIK